MANEDRVFTEEEAMIVLAALGLGLGESSCEKDHERLLMGLELAHKTFHLLEEEFGVKWGAELLQKAETLIKSIMLERGVPQEIIDEITGRPEEGEEWKSAPTFDIRTRKDWN